MKMILGKKLGMTTIYTEEKAQHVTLVDTNVNSINGVRTEEKDGYTAIQVKFTPEDNKEVVSEFRVDEFGELKKGDKIEATQFSEGDKVIVKGISKGKGYQGVVKRHGFAGSPASHGHRHDLRAPGSIGSAFPERVMKGKRMAGRMGSQSVTVKNLEIIQVGEDGIIAIKGALPGNNKGIVKIISQD